MRKCITIAAILLGCVAVATPAHAGSFFLYAPPAADSIIAGPPGEGNVLQVTSDTAGSGYGGMYYDASTDGLLLASLTKLSALYEMTTGTFDGGAPRFTLFDFSGNSAYIYWGTPAGGGSFTDPNGGSFTTTGNLASVASPDVRVYVNGFGGQNTPNTGETYAQFVADLGTTPVQYVTLDLDGGFTGKQQMITDEFTVNSAVYEAGPDPSAGATPEPASLTLLGIGIAGMAGYGLRRRKRATT